MAKVTRMIAIVTAIALLGTALYMLTEQVGFFDGLYFALATITTVGYGDIVPLTRGGQVVAMVLMVGGVGTALCILSSIMSFVIEGRLGEIMGVRKMKRTIEQMRGHYIVCGFGKLGVQVVAELQAGGADFVIIETNPQKAADGRDKGFPVIEGDATRQETLSDAGIDRCAGVATTISDDAENLYIGLTVRGLQAKVPVVCRSSSNRVRPLFERAGIERIISTDEIGARRMVYSLMRPHIVQFMDELMTYRSGTPSLHAIRLEPGAKLEGHTLESARLRNEYDVVVLAIQHAGSPILPNPGPRETFKGDDLLILIGKPEQVERLREWVEVPEDHRPPAPVPEAEQA